MRKEEILILDETDLIDKSKETMDEYLNPFNFKLSFHDIAAAYMIVFNDKHGNTCILKNRWGKEGLVGNSNLTSLKEK